MAAAGGYGWLENKSKADATFFLNKLPKPINQIGFAGNTALALYVAAHFTKNKWVRLLARGTAVVAAYQLGRKGAVFASGTDVFTISGGWEEQAIEDHLMGHLNPEGTQMQGVPFDDAVADAMAFSGG